MKIDNRTLAFIGAGNMTRAIISGLIQAGYPATHITASNPSTGKLEQLQYEFAIDITQNNLYALEQAEVVILAVKPQLMQQVCNELSENDNIQNKLLVSLAAGITTTRLAEMLNGHQQIVRAMPNTPSALGLGMTGIYANQAVAKTDLIFVESLLKSIGKTTLLKNESQIDGVIAAAGSSPAYFFLFLEAMQSEAIRMGFDQQQSREMIAQAMLGAAQMVIQNGNIDLAELRLQVTSKGGTTAKAIEAFQQADLQGIVAKAMQAARDRAEEMAAQF
jgi:pyrroline-5-carboxylate reductase